MHAITARGLRKTYGRTVAVDSLDLDVEQGTVLGFLGPNGAGKTSAIRILSTVLEPDAGTFAVGGIPHTDPVRIRRRVGVLPESAGYPSSETGEEWLVYHAQLFGSPRREALSTAKRLLGEVGLPERGSSPIRTMSRGMRQRLGIARALVNNPDVVFLDEPTIARERGVTVVLSTHLLAEVEQVCDRVLILNHGRLVSDGTVAEVASLAVGVPDRVLLNVAADQQQEALQLLLDNGIDAASASEGRLGEAFLTLTEDPP